MLGPGKQEIQSCTLEEGDLHGGLKIQEFHTVLSESFIWAVNWRYLHAYGRQYLF
jgi:hypothetical protein